MYFVKYGEEYLHDPRIKNYRLIDISLESEENSAPTCEFTIYKGHPMYNKIKVKDVKHEIVVLDDDYEIFRGYIEKIGDEFDLNKQVKCTGDLAYLNMTIVKPYSTKKEWCGYTTISDKPDSFFKQLILWHNLKVDENCKFTIGVNDAYSIVGSSSLYSKRDDYKKTSEVIQDELIDKYGGFVRVRHEEGTRYLDYISEWENVNTQILDFGVNLLDFKKTEDSTSIITHLIPTGAKVSATSYSYNDGYYVTKDKEVKPGKKYYRRGYEECPSMTKFESGVQYYRMFKRYFKTKDKTPNPNKSYYHWGGGSKIQSLDVPKNSRTFPKVDGYGVHECVEHYYKIKVNPAKDKPEPGVSYYTYNGHNYNECIGLKQFTVTEWNAGKGKYTTYTPTYYEYVEYDDESDIPINISEHKNSKGRKDYLISETNGQFYKQGNLVCNLEAAEKYGVSYGYYKDTEITKKSELVTAAYKELKKTSRPSITIEVKAIDLSLVNPEYKAIRVGDYVRVRSKPHNFDSYMLCKEITLDLNNPENSEYIFGETYDVITGKVNGTIQRLNDSIDKVFTRVDNISAEAKETAKATLDAQKKIVMTQTLWYVSTSDKEPTGGEWTTVQPIGGE